MPANPLLKNAKPVFEMNSAKAREWAGFAASRGDHDKAKLWAAEADRLAAAEAQASWGKRADLA